MTPREPHLLARRVERDRQPSQHAVARAERRAPQEHASLGVDEGRCAAVRDGHTLGLARRAGGEDDPRVVGEGRWLQRVRGVVSSCTATTRSPPRLDAVVGEDGGDVGLTEHEVGAFLGVVGVDGYVGRAGAQDPDDADVQVGASRRHADADPVAPAHSGLVQPRRDLPGGVPHLTVGEDVGVGVDRGLIAEPLHDSCEDVDEGARRRGQGSPAQGRGRSGSGHV